MRRRRQRQRGQALLEAALATMSFLVVMVGMLDLAQVLFVHQGLVERVRSATRRAAVQTYDADVIKNLILYNQSTAPSGGEDDDEGGSGTPEDPKGYFGLDPSMITVSRQGVATNGDRIVETLSDYPFTFFTPFIAAVHSGKPITATIPYEGL